LPNFIVTYATRVGSGSKLLPDSLPGYLILSRETGLLVFNNIPASVPDPDPDPPDPYVFGPPGSGSFYHQAKRVRKTLIPAVFLLDYLSLKMT
jgi:hypothetical protein